MSVENLQAQIARDQQHIADAGYAVHEKNKPIPYTQLRRIEVETESKYPYNQVTELYGFLYD